MKRSSSPVLVITGSLVEVADGKFELLKEGPRLERERRCREAVKVARVKNLEKRYLITRASGMIFLSFLVK